MRRRWYYWKRIFRMYRPVRAAVWGMLAISVAIGIWEIRPYFAETCRELFEEYGVVTAKAMIETWFPSEVMDHDEWGWKTICQKAEVFSFLEDLRYSPELAEDPAYKKMLAQDRRESAGKEDMGGEEADKEDTGKEERDREDTGKEERDREDTGKEAAGGEDDDMEEKNGEKIGGTEAGESEETSLEAVTAKRIGSSIIREKLADYDYMIQNFYSIHPTTTAGRDWLDAERFLSLDLSVEKNMTDPQILIYHTHSQEEFADYPENPEATIVGVGAYLADCMREHGYQVIHDSTVYDMRGGQLDRNQAYSYALDGIVGILQKYPTIDVVLDLHRDGVDENTKLVTEVNGKPAAKIMFFNGTSQSPDGPIEYLPNPNRESNMAFSFQMQVLAAEQYPGLTRKIYLKGLRYNQHVRARTALVEVGAQTNTYAEALNAMEPLADLLCQVLDGT